MSHPSDPNPINRSHARSMTTGEAQRLAARAEELLLDRATVGLSASEEAELELALARLGRPLDESFEMTAAAIDLAFTPPKDFGAAMPAELRARILSAGEAWSAQQRSPNADLAAEQAARLTLVGMDDDASRRRVRGGATWRAWSGWMAAAACLAFAVYTRTNAPATTGSDPTASLMPLGDMIRRELGLNAPGDRVLSRIQTLRFAQNADVVVTPILNVSGEGPSDPTPLGDVIWSCSAQKGVLVLRRLPALTCESDTYQLWIADPMRDSRYPVPAGTFRVGRDPVTFVEFSPALKIAHAERFIITIERDGGVLVTDGVDVTGVTTGPAVPPVEAVTQPVEIERGTTTERLRPTSGFDGN